MYAKIYISEDNSDNIPLNNLKKKPDPVLYKKLSNAICPTKETESKESKQGDLAIQGSRIERFDPFTFSEVLKYTSFEDDLNCILVSLDFEKKISHFFKHVECLSDLAKIKYIKLYNEINNLSESLKNDQELLENILKFDNDKARQILLKYFLKKIDNPLLFKPENIKAKFKINKKELFEILIKDKKSLDVLLIEKMPQNKIDDLFKSYFYENLEIDSNIKNAFYKYYEKNKLYNKYDYCIKSSEKENNPLIKLCGCLTLEAACCLTPLPFIGIFPLINILNIFNITRYSLICCGWQNNETSCDERMTQNMSLLNMDMTFFIKQSCYDKTITACFCAPELTCATLVNISYASTSACCLGWDLGRLYLHAPDYNRLRSDH